MEEHRPSCACYWCGHGYEEKCFFKPGLAGVGAQTSWEPVDSGEGRKNDSFGKPGQKARWDLLPWDEVDEVVGVLTDGAVDYGDDNWRKVDKWEQRYFSAAMRHLKAWKSGKPMDASGHRHLAHAVASILFLMARDK